MELNIREDFNTLKELIKLINLDIKIIEKDGILNIFRYVGHDNDMRCAKEEYKYLYAFTNNPNHTYSEYEKLALFKAYLETEKYNLLYVNVKGVSCLIDEIEIWIGYESSNYDLMIAYTLGRFFSTRIEDENEICIGPNSSKEIYLL